MGDIRPGEVSELWEDDHRLFAVVVLEHGDRRIRLGTVEWPKPDFDQWWSAARDQYANRTPPQVGEYELKPIKSVTGTPNSWQTIGTAGSPPHARSNHTAIWTGSEMIVWGGDDGVGYVYSGSRYDPSTDSWTAMTNIGHPLGRWDHTAVWTGSEMIVWGGERGGPTNTGGRYYPTTNSWLGVTTSGAPSARAFHTAVFIRLGMVVWGGWNGSTYLGNGRYYAPNTDFWTVVNDSGAPSPRSDQTVVVHFDSSRRMCGTGGSGEAMVVFGGQNSGGVLGDGAYYCDLNDTWVALSSDGAPAARVGHSAVSTRKPGGKFQEMIIWGGNDGSNNLVTGAIWEFNRNVQNQWKPMTLGNVPASRQGHSAVWAGNGMMIWGGYSGAALHRTGGLYNPDNNVWLQTSTSGAPTARKDHTAVWNGISTSAYHGEVMVWGGYDGVPASSGGLYSLPSDFVITCDPRILTSVPEGAELFAFEVTVTSMGEFSDPVTLSHTAFPGSLMIWDNPVTPTPSIPGKTDVDLFVNAGASVGDHSFFFKGTSGNTRYFPMTLRVQDFQLSCQPSSVTVAPGGSTNATCTVSSVNAFADPVALSCTSGTITCSVSPSEVTPPQDGSVDAEVTITVGAGVTPGTYTIIPTAQSHLAERFSPIEVIVQDGAGLIFADGFESGNATAWN